MVIDQLDIQHLTSGFESVHVAPLHQTLSAYEHLAISGPSGCGKSSLLQILAGLAPPKQGTISWQGNLITPQRLPQWRRDICYLPQQPVMGGETVSQVLLLPWRLNAMQSAIPNEAECQEALEQLGLHHSLDKSVAALSGGEKQRLGFARALLMKRAIWLLDEPTSALDARSRDKVIELLAAIQAIKISVSHDPHWLACCDFVHQMESRDE
ncbi:ATP-binding cassette domain-containing protein [Photobacterium swingsii]|uniref:ABC transporter ATP-binding protein n=1 Tax=Photobacterium swingsii TaxID=680026 RepID=UPI00352BF86B